MAHGGTLRTVTAALVCALALGAAPSMAAAHTADVPKDEASEDFSPRRYYTTWRDSRSYWSQDTRYATGGWLWAGRNAFFCQIEGEPHSDGQGRMSTWWVLTDDSVGNLDVFVSATSLRVAEPWKPVDGLPRC
ncbi:hypothetical protein DFP74_1054 [Nocardiopsis sp. Huas11]|uniref:hypothetical protein n=1 Tax=Nocardiopsis sp. Huas11 TaxID=2183912 RepID=UPI000F1BBCD9|nr:hypothetical protein [Nocardiopsis sp. Huas11]RKS05455.1 hypothetical protein DFP74_1054 [Nocardiopsis sp. Huas11]